LIATVARYWRDRSWKQEAERVALRRGARWAFWSLAICLGFLQAAGFASDSFFHYKDLAANVGSSVLLLSGLGCAAVGIFREGNEAA
jgi:hypothetical membrane protein